MDTPRWRKRAKDVALTRIDEAAYSVLLREAFPGIVFVGYWPLQKLKDHDRGMTAEWLEANSFDSIHTVEDNQVRAIVPSCRWRPLPLAVDGYSYNVEGPYLDFTYHRGHWDWRTHRGAKLAYDPPTLSFGNINTSYLTDEPALKAFYEKALRLVRKVSTNKVRRELPHIGFVYGDGTSSFWIGHDAFRWCSESPTRMVGGLVRPTLDWEFPDVPWYRAVDGVERGFMGPQPGWSD